MIEQYHYSAKVPTGKNLFFGWYDGDDLYAVADYGIGVNPFQASFLSRVTGCDVRNDNLLELKRLARIEPKRDSMPLTRFLSLAHKALKRKGFEFVVSFSDPEHNHTGGIYKAANFVHYGYSNAEWHVVDKEGVKRHRRYAYRYAQRNGCTIAEARELLGLTRERSKPKDRWLISIGRQKIPAHFSDEQKRLLNFHFGTIGE